MKADYGYAHLLYKIREGAKRVLTCQPQMEQDDSVMFDVMYLPDHVVTLYNGAPQSDVSFEINVILIIMYWTG